MSNLHNQLAVSEKEDVARGIRVLLRSPLITERADPAVFDLVRRRASPIGQWFDYHCGWTVIAEPRLGYVRLVKVGAGRGRDASRPARRARSSHAPFDRRRYTLLCVAAAELMSTPVTTISLLADRIAHACAADPVLPSFDSSMHRERMSLVDVISLLESLGVLEIIDGTAAAYASSAEAKVLFRVDVTLLVRLLAAPTGPSNIGVPPEEIGVRFAEVSTRLIHEQRYGTAPDEPVEQRETLAGNDVQRNLWLRHSIMRRIFDDPVVYREDLSPAQRDYLSSPTGRRILRQAVDQAGFDLEERAEGYLLVDPDGIATDTRFPAETASTAKTAALLLLDTLCAAPEGLDSSGLAEAGRAILDRASGWAKAYRTDNGAARLVTDGCEVLADFHLAHWSGHRFRARPAASRYTAGEVRTAPEPEPEVRLW